MRGVPGGVDSVRIKDMGAYCRVAEKIKKRLCLLMMLSNLLILQRLIMCLMRNFDMLNRKVR